MKISDNKVFCDRCNKLLDINVEVCPYCFNKVDKTEVRAVSTGKQFADLSFFFVGLFLPLVAIGIILFNGYSNHPSMRLLKIGAAIGCSLEVFFLITYYISQL